MHDPALVLLAVTISAYWVGVGRMIVRARRRARAPGSGPVRAQGDAAARHALWLLWLPVVAAWIALPWLGLSSRDGLFAPSPFAAPGTAYGIVRWLAALLGVGCLAATIRCWRRMGRDWRMDVSADTSTVLITDGPFRRIRHPIYAWSMLLMLCTAAVVPNAPMLVVAGAHVVLMNVKARSEERHLEARHGDAWRRYVARTGRFLPYHGTRP